MKVRDFIMNGGDTLWKIENVVWTVQMYYDNKSRFSWLVKISYEQFKFSWWYIIPSTQFQRVRRASHHPALMGNQQISSLLFWLIHAVNSTLRFCSWWCLLQEGCCCGFSDFWWNWFHIMVGKFAVRHLCGGFLYGKMTAWINANAICLFPLWLVLLIC